MLGQKQGNFVLPQKINPASALGKSDYFFYRDISDLLFTVFSTKYMHARFI